MDEAVANGWFQMTTDAVEELTGRPPTSVFDFLAEHSDVLFSGAEPTFARATPPIGAQPDRAYSGRYAFITGLAAGTTPSTYDLDGRTTIRSVPVTMPATGGAGNLTFRYTFVHGLISSADWLKAFVEDGAGTRTLVWSNIGSWRSVDAMWVRASVPMNTWSDQTIRIVFEAADGGRDSLLEVGIDDVRVERP